MMARAAFTPVQVPLWQAMADAEAPLTVRDLEQRAGVSIRSMRLRLTCWVNAGLVSRIDGREPQFVLTEQAVRTAPPPITDRSGRITPRRRCDRERIWSAMRVLRDFDAPMLRMASEATARSIATYLDVLQRAGYVRMTRRGSAKTGRWARYALLRNTGPKSPQVSHNATRRHLVDRNTGARIDIAPHATSLRRKKAARVVDGGVG